MPEYIELTEELILAVNAGARAIEQSKRFYGATYCMDVFSENPKEIPYVTAANVLRSFDEIPAADVVAVVRCKDCKYRERLRFDGFYHCCNEDAGMATGIVLNDNDFCSYGERRDEDD